MIRILGIIDLILVFIILAEPVLTKTVILVAAGYLIIKGILFTLLSQNFASYADIMIGLYVLSMTIGFSFSLFTVISVIFLAQKGLVSLA